MNKQYIELKSDVLLMVRELSSHTLALFDDINESLTEHKPVNVVDEAKQLLMSLQEINRRLLSLLAHPDRRDAGALSNFGTYSRRLVDKLVNFSILIDTALVDQLPEKPVSLQK